MFQVLFAAVAISAATIHIACSSERRSSTVSVAATYLIYLLVIYVGVMGVFTEWAHVFQPSRTSASIGWPTSPYEYGCMLFSPVTVLAPEARRQSCPSTEMNNNV